MIGKREQRIFNVFCIVALILICVLAAIQLVFGGQYSSEAISQRTQTITLNASRGKILDSKGVVLASSINKYDLFVDQYEVSKFVPTTCNISNEKSCHQINGKDVDGQGAIAVAKILATVLPQNEMEIGGKINGTSRYSIIAKDLSVETKKNIENLHLGNCIGFNLNQKRMYTNENLAGSILGAVDSEQKGSGGIELMQENVLRGVDGVYSYERGLSGTEIPGGNKTYIPAQNGKNVKLTIDSDVQIQVQNILNTAAANCHPTYGIAIVQEVKTGKLIAVADTFSPKAGSSEAVLESSKALTALFEPGSTSKVITAAGLIDRGLANPNSKYSVPSKFSIDGQEFSDAEEHGVERLTLTGVLAQSSNVGTVMASKDLPNEDRYNLLSSFGVNEPVGIGFPGECEGVLSKFEQWDARTQHTVLFGQAYSTGAIQMTNAFSTVANKGIKVKPKLIEGIENDEGKYDSPQGNNEEVRVIKEETSRDLMNMMEKTVTDGIVVGIDVPGYRVAGKTGTAEMVGSGGKLSNIMASFIGAFPADNPKYVVSVFFKNPQGAYFGALTAAPAANKIMNILASYYTIPLSGKSKNNLSTTW